MEKEPQALQGLIHQHELSPSATSPKDGSDLPELTAQELSELVLKARQAKAERLTKEAYWNKVRSEYKPAPMDPGQLAFTVQHNFHNLNNREFILDDWNRDIFYNLCAYFTGNDGVFDLKKGIMLCGNIGVGKTEMMKLFCTNPHQSFGFTSCRNIVNEFINSSSDDIKQDQIHTHSQTRKAAKPHRYSQDYLGTCFDDLGTEQIPAVHYGNRKNVMSEILLNRYDNRLPFNMTHITTNLTQEKILDTYGDRLVDRMAQMFNIVSFNQLQSRR